MRLHPARSRKRCFSSFALRQQEPITIKMVIQDSKFQGQAFVTFASQDELSRALTLHRSCFYSDTGGGDAKDAATHSVQTNDLSDDKQTKQKKKKLSKSEYVRKKVRGSALARDAPCDRP